MRDLHTKVFNGIHILKDRFLYSVKSLKLVGSLSSYLHNIAFNGLKSHVPSSHPTFYFFYIVLIYQRNLCTFYFSLAFFFLLLLLLIAMDQEQSPVERLAKLVPKIHVELTTTRCFV